MHTELFLKGRLRHELAAQEKTWLEEAIGRTIRLEPRETLVKRGTRVEHSYYIIEGTVLRHLDDRSGERQLVGLNIPGDFVDLHGFPMKRLDHSTAALGPVDLAEVPHSAIAELVNRSGHLARALWFSTLLDAAMHREWIFRLGRLKAEARIAHLICEIIERHKFVGLYDGRNLPVSLLQRDYAEACGITPVHANRSFRILKERGVLELRGEGRIEIHDEAELKRLGEFRGDYLYGEGDLALDSFEDRDKHASR
ncbi:Crp/Fnr family transcriptional regulator [Alteriqipengyuania flavescens]|uniref:Crp/Fnr family transcriptional regulator n=1 Tax=Alteriqipengyuania flavescens TaxID=3053610 RepID=UPI0025B2AAD5|nr:Crp/Fnr family transcriptional regulator [Alteriqipengyuania flavescens]WJY17816.1 Crp/Fnr family transcriptional regulator [Alteriqipengyuania flavescens]WJY23758.1 Crp/Fnr family transcriptional regulator [Alteriqipengyuania flavescens]